jgi:hypothetical protein
VHCRKLKSLELEEKRRVEGWCEMVASPAVSQLEELLSCGYSPAGKDVSRGHC